MLPIIDNSDLFDFQKKGNHYNWHSGLPEAPQDSLLTFSFTVFGGQTLTSFDAKKVRVDGTDVTVLSTTDLLSSNPPNEETLRNGKTRYEQRAEAFLTSLLDDGLYYYYLSDGNFEKKSELFCIKEGFLIIITGEVFNIFNSALGYSGVLALDDSGNSFNFTLTNGRCAYSNGSAYCRYPNDLDLSGHTITNGGTATGTIDDVNKIITFTQGTIYNLTIEDGSLDLHFPFVENYLYVYDVNYSERMYLYGFSWINQNNYFYLGGMQEIVNDDTSEIYYVPYNQFGAIQFTEAHDQITNRYLTGGNSYVLNQIVKNAGTYYKTSTPFTSTDFSSDSGNLTSY